MNAVQNTTTIREYISCCKKAVLNRTFNNYVPIIRQFWVLLKWLCRCICIYLALTKYSKEKGIYPSSEYNLTEPTIRIVVLYHNVTCFRTNTFNTLYYIC